MKLLPFCILIAQHGTVGVCFCPFAKFGFQKLRRTNWSNQKEEDKEQEEEKVTRKLLTINSEVNVLRTTEEWVREMEWVSTSVLLTNPPQQQTCLQAGTWKLCLNTNNSTLTNCNINNATFPNCNISNSTLINCIYQTVNTTLTKCNSNTETT